MKRYDYLSAEMFGYSYEHYQEKIDIGNKRFTRYMPSQVKLLEKGLKELWPNERISYEIEIDIKEVDEYKISFGRALMIVDQKNTTSKFVAGIKDTFDVVLENEKISEAAKELLLEQLLYRAKDYEFVLRREIESEIINLRDDEWHKTRLNLPITRWLTTFRS